MSARYKDANECLQAGVEVEVMRECLRSAMDFAPEKVRSVREFYEEFMGKWFGEDLEPGLELPWGFPWKVRHSELTLWLGVEGSGKTTLLNFVLVGLLHQGERGLIASFEWPVPDTLMKLSRQVYGDLIFDRKAPGGAAKGASRTGGTADGRAEYEARCRVEAGVTFEWMAARLWVYEHCGIGRWRELMDDMRWARRRFGITQFVIDNFMRLGIVKDDYAQQADAITQLAALAMELQVHIHVVLHQNKSERKDGGKGAAAGAFELLANAHNIVEVLRDEKKGKKVSDLFADKEIGKVSQEEFEKAKEALDVMPDGTLRLLKQRTGRHQDGSKHLWFLWRSQQYADKPPRHHEHAPIKFTESKGTAVVELPTEEQMGLGVAREMGNE